MLSLHRKILQFLISIKYKKRVYADIRVHAWPKNINIKTQLPETDVEAKIGYDLDIHSYKNVGEIFQFFLHIELCISFKLSPV